MSSDGSLFIKSLQQCSADSVIHRRLFLYLFHTYLRHSVPPTTLPTPPTDPAVQRQILLSCPYVDIMGSVMIRKEGLDILFPLLESLPTLSLWIPFLVREQMAVPYLVKLLNRQPHLWPFVLTEMKAFIEWQLPLWEWLFLSLDNEFHPYLIPSWLQFQSCATPAHIGNMLRNMIPLKDTHRPWNLFLLSRMRWTDAEQVAFIEKSVNLFLPRDLPDLTYSKAFSTFWLNRWQHLSSEKIHLLTKNVDQNSLISFLQLALESNWPMQQRLEWTEKIKDWIGKSSLERNEKLKISTLFNKKDLIDLVPKFAGSSSVALCQLDPTLSLIL